MNYFNYDAYKKYINGTSLDNQEHIDYLLNRKLEFINEREYYYIEIKQHPDGFFIPMDKIGNIFRSNDLDKDCSNLYELLKNGHQFRHSSLHEFFENTNATSIQTSKKWLESKEYAFSDSSATNSSKGELPSASYYEGIDRFLITTGQNRALAGLLIGAKEDSVENISYYRPKVKTNSEEKDQQNHNDLDKNKQGIINRLTKWVTRK